jgi:hypothetical protein
MLAKNFIMRICMIFIYCQVLLGDQMKVCEIGRACGTCGVEGQSIHGLVEKYERKELLGRPRHTWEVNSRMDFKGIGCDGVDWIHLSG